MTDQQLIAQAVRGNSEAFGRLVRRYQGRLFHSVCYLVRSRVDAEDVVQDLFDRAFVKLNTFRQHCAFYTWLYRIALNLWHARGRHQRIHACLFHARPITEDDPSDPRGRPEEELQRREEANLIAAALRALSAEHRTILALRGVEWFDYRTIARVLQVKVGTVRSRLYRARRELRDQLKAASGSGPLAREPRQLHIAVQ